MGAAYSFDFSVLSRLRHGSRTLIVPVYRHRLRVTNGEKTKWSCTRRSLKAFLRAPAKTRFKCTESFTAHTAAIRFDVEKNEKKNEKPPPTVVLNSIATHRENPFERRVPVAPNKRPFPDRSTEISMRFPYYNSVHYTVRHRGGSCGT